MISPPVRRTSRRLGRARNVTTPHFPQRESRTTRRAPHTGDRRCRRISLITTYRCKRVVLDAGAREPAVSRACGAGNHAAEPRPGHSGQQRFSDLDESAWSRRRSRSRREPSSRVSSATTKRSVISRMSSRPSTPPRSTEAEVKRFVKQTFGVSRVVSRWTARRPGGSLAGSGDDGVDNSYSRLRSVPSGIRRGDLGLQVSFFTSYGRGCYGIDRVRFARRGNNPRSRSNAIASTT